MPQLKQKTQVGERIDLTADTTIVQVPDLVSLAKNDEDRAVYEDLLAKSTDIKVEKGLGYGEVTVIVSNDTIDRYGESIKMNGIDLTQIKRNPVVLWGHQYSNLPIGKIVKLWKQNGNLMATIKLDYDIYDFANIVYQMILRGTINAVSIGGIVREWGADYETIEKLEMVELSVVPVGANPDALVVAKSLGMKAETVAKQFETFVQKALVDKMAPLDDDEVNKHIETLEALTAALKATAANRAQQTTTVERKATLITLKSLAGQADATAGDLNKTIKITLKQGE